MECIHTCKGNYNNYWSRRWWCRKMIRWKNKGVIFKNYVPFTKCISRINNTDIDNAQDIDIVIPMYNLIEYSDNYSKTSGSLWRNIIKMTQTIIKRNLNHLNLKFLNIFRIQAYDLIMFGYFCIGFIDFMLTGKKLTDYTNLFSLYGFKRSDNIILSYFKYEWN